MCPHPGLACPLPSPAGTRWLRNGGSFRSRNVAADMVPRVPLISAPCSCRAAEDALGAATTTTTKTATTTNITAVSADALYDSATALGAFVNFVEADNAGYVDVSAADGNRRGGSVASC